MPSDELGWRHYSGFAPCIITQTNVLGRPGGGEGRRCRILAALCVGVGQEAPHPCGILQGGAGMPHLLRTLLHFAYDVVHDVEVAHQVEAGLRVMQPFARVRRIEHVQCPFGRYAQALAQQHDDAPYLVPQEEVV